MSQQKHRLKDRLKQLKANKSKSVSGAQSKHAGENKEEVDEIHVEEANLQRLEENYDKIAGMLAAASSEELERIGLTRIKDLLNQSSTGEGVPLVLQVITYNSDYAKVVNTTLACPSFLLFSVLSYDTGLHPSLVL